MRTAQRVDEMVIEPAGVDDLHLVRDVVAQAIEAWPTTERLKRNALSVLAYDAVDLADTQVVMARLGTLPVGVAAWRTGNMMADPDGQLSGLLHGLYVDRRAQRTGVGMALQQHAASEVLQAGGYGLHVRAERFAASYFERCGYRRLAAGELVGVTGAYPYRYWIACAPLIAR